MTTAVQSIKETGQIDVAQTLVSAAVGAVSGGIAATRFGMMTQAAITAGTAIAGDITTQIVCEGKTLEEINIYKAAHNGLLAGATSIAGSLLGTVTSIGYTTTGNSMVSLGKDKLLSGYVSQCVGQSSSKLLKQGAKLIAEGTKYINTGRGISSVTGTLLTWGAGLEYSW